MMKRTLASLALSLAFALATPPLLAQDTAKSEAQLADGRKSLQKGDLKTAIIQLKNAVQANPANLAARFELGVAQLRAGDLLSAEKELNTVKEKNFTGKDVSAPLAELYMRQRKYEAIVNEIQAGDRPADEEAGVRLARGYALFALQRRDEAEKSLLDSLERASNPSRAQVALARVKASAADFDAALDYAKKATESDAKNTEAFLMLSQVHSARRELDLARAAVNKAVEQSPNETRLRLSRAQLLIDANELQLAQSDVNAALTTEPKNPSAQYLDAVLQARQQNWRASESALQKMGGALGQFPPALYLEASVKLAQGSLAQAEDSINRYLALRPGDGSGSMFLANLLMRRNALPRAVEVLGQAAEKNPKDVRVLAQLSDAYIRNKQPEQADAVLDRLTELAPNDATFRTQLAAQRLRLGQADEAIADLEAATELDPNAASASILLVLTNLQAGKLDEARKTAEGLRARQPENPVTENLLGVIALRQRDPDAARKHFEASLKIKEDFAPARMNIAQIEKLLNHPEKARAIYQQILGTQPANEAALVALSDLSLADQKLDDAILWLEKARNSNQRSVMPRLRLAELYLQRRDMQKAIAVARETVQVAPQDARSQNALGVALLANGETESALQALRRAIDLDPNSAATQFQLARAYMNQKDFKTARNWMEKGLATNLADLDMQTRYLEFAVAAQESEAALDFARKLAAQRAGDPAADLLLGGALEISGKQADAASIYERGLARGDNLVFVQRLASLYTRLNQPEKSAATLQRWVGKFPSDERTRFQLATLLLTTEKYDESAREHEALLKAQPDNPVYLNNLAWIYDQRNDTRAQATAERAYNAAQTPMISDTYGWILVKKGDTAKALPILERAATDSPRQPAIRFHYAVALKNAGKSAEARREIETALKDEAALGAEAEAARKLLAELGG